MHRTMLGIPIALEAFKASKEVLVRRPAPPGIRPFLENKRSIGEVINIGMLAIRQFYSYMLHPLRNSQLTSAWCKWQFKFKFRFISERQQKQLWAGLLLLHTKNRKLLILGDSRPLGICPLACPVGLHSR